MKRKQLKKLFNKYINNECTDHEVKLLDAYLDSFQDKDNLWSDLNYDESLKEELWLKIKSKALTETKVKPFNYKTYLKYAAVFAGLSLGLLWYQLKFGNTSGSEIMVSDTTVTVKTSGTTAKIDTDGSQVLLNKNGEVVGKQEGTQISYEKNESIKELIYNEVFVPNGKKIEVLLSDGTMVYMNSGSSLKFPINFIPGHKRQVFLEGEAYFEVTKNPNNPFQVSTSNMEVKVLGTHFNVSAYHNTQTFAVLAEGSIAVNKKENNNIENEATIIIPGEKATITEKAIDVKTVNLEDYIGWRDNRLSFNDEPFVDIIKKIERHYGVSINNKYVALNPIQFKGTFKDETILDLLNTFKETANFNYIINSNNITIYENKLNQ